MFRPNRIGDHKVADLSAADFALDASTANFAASVGTLSAHQVQAHTATLGDPIATVNFDTVDVTSAWALITLKSYSFGVFVTGAALNDRAMMLAYSLNASLKITTTSTAFELSANMGIANATSVTVDKTAATNLMDTRCILKVKTVESASSNYSINAQGTVLNSLFNGGASGVFDTNPLGLWLSIVNTGTSTITLSHLQGSMSLYRYSRDIDTFDPNR